MTTAPDHHEPLDDEERELAARLGRIGPFDGPSPALDAKILAAAHAAAVTRRPGRRLAWLGVPPALVTGVGVAAAAVLALGLVWQLRPQPGLVTADGEADSGEEIILIAEPAGAAQAPALNPPPLPQDAPAASAGRAQRAMPPATPAPMSQDRAKAVAAQARTAMADEAAVLAAQAASATEEKREAESFRDAAADPGFVAEPPAASAPARKSHATYTTAARARAEQRERAASNAAAAAAPPPPASTPPVAETAPASAAATAEAGTTLDRIEVTGSRIRTDQYIDWSQVPVSDDVPLAAAEWLERIRARRDGDDIDNARASLLLFQREYPRVRLPDDQRELLADAKR